MDLCINGCGDVFNSRELLDSLSIALDEGRANNSPQHTQTIEDIALQVRIERKVKDKLRKKGYSNANHYNN